MISAYEAWAAKVGIIAPPPGWTYLQAAQDR
jgi:hypothetical protein